MTGSARRTFAVITREIRDLGRSKTPYALRTVFAGLVGVLTVGVFSMALAGVARGATTVAAARLAEMTFFIFQSVTWVQSFLVLVMGAILGVASAAAERRNRTLGLLVLSRLRPTEIVVGKTAALLGLMVMALLAALPLFAVVGWGGGLDYGWLARSALLALVTAALALALGLAFGFAFRSFSLGAVAALASALALFFAPFWIQARSASRIWPWIEPLWIGSAVSAVARQGIVPSPFLRPLVASSVMAVGLLAVSVLVLRRAAVHGSARGLRGSFERLDAIYERLNLGGVRLPSIRRRLPRANPVAGLARTTSGLGAGRYGLRVALATFAVGLVVVTGLVGEDHWAPVAAAIAVPLVFLMAVGYGAAAVAGERSRRTLAVLLATPLTAGRIVAGKSVASLQLFAIVVLPTAVLLVVLSPATLPRTDVLVEGLALFGAQAALAFCLALGASLFLTNALRAGITGFVLLLAANTLPWAIGGLTWEAVGAGRGWAWRILGLLGLILGAGALAAWRSAHRGPKLLAGLLLVLAAVGFAAGYPVANKIFVEKLSGGLDGLPVVGEEPELALYVAYLLGLAALVYLAVVRSFDRALSRAT